MGNFRFFAFHSFALLFLALMLPECAPAHSQLETYLKAPYDPDTANLERKILNEAARLWSTDFRDLVGCKLRLSICHAGEPNYVNAFAKYAKEEIVPFLMEMRLLLAQPDPLDPPRVRKMGFSFLRIIKHEKKYDHTCPAKQVNPKKCDACVQKWVQVLAKTMPDSATCPGCPLCLRKDTREIVGYKGGFTESNETSFLVPPKEWAAFDPIWTIL